jgi:SAM-dependent methyltransferase
MVCGACPRMMGALRWRVFLVLRLLGRGLYKSSRLLSFLAAGVLNQACLRRIIESEFDDFFANDHEVRLGLWRWERDFFGRFLEPGSSLLVVGAGSGRDVLGLLDAGHRVDGVELSGRSADRARRILAESGRHATIHTAAIEDWTPSERYDAIVFSWRCYSCIPIAKRRVEILEKLRERLLPGGRILISYLLDREDSSPGMQIVQWLTWLTRSDWRPERGDEMASRFASVRFRHNFRPGEIEAEVLAAGLRVVWHQTTPDSLLVLERSVTGSSGSTTPAAAIEYSAASGGPT